MKRLLIIGAGDAGHILAQELERNPNLAHKYELVGFIDDDIAKTQVEKYPVIGKSPDIERLINDRKIDEVLIAIPSASRETIRDIFEAVTRTRVTVKIVPGFREIIDGNFTSQQIRDIEPSDLLGREEVDFEIDKIEGFYKNKTIYVTGAGGSIGSEIVAQLLELSVKKVVAMGHGENSIYSLMARYSGDRRFVYVIGDIKDRAKVAREVELHRPQVVFHAAAHKHVPLMEDYPDEAAKNNILGTYVVATEAQRLGVGNFVLVSTDKAVNPTSVMGATKRLAERVVLSLGAAGAETIFSVTRFGNVLGSRGSVVPLFKEQIARGGPITVTHPEMTRYFMSIREAARLVIKSASLAGPENRIFVLDMGKPFKIVDLARNLIRMCGRDESEIQIAFTGLRPGEKLYEEVLTDSEDTQSTRFSKLFVSKGRGHDELKAAELKGMIDEVEEAAQAGNPSQLRKLIKKYVPEYENQG